MVRSAGSCNELQLDIAGKGFLWMYAGSFHDLAMHPGQHSALDFHGWNSFCMKNN